MVSASKSVAQMVKVPYFLAASTTLKNKRIKSPAVSFSTIL